MKLTKTMKYDILFQFRHGFYYAYLFVSILYIVILRTIPENSRQIVAALLIFTDTSIIGFFFIGGIVLLEKGQKTLENLFVTPLTIYQYFLSKILSLTLLSLVMSLLIMTASFGFNYNPLPVLLAVILGAVFFTILGLSIASRAKSTNAYLMSMPVCMIAFFAPLLDYFEVVQTPLLYLFPTRASLVLLDAAFKPVGVMEVVYALACFIIWGIPAILLAHQWFRKYIVLRIGEG